MRSPNKNEFVVDCEYSSETNELISMAIVPLWIPFANGFGGGEAVAQPHREFYEVISPLPPGLSEWVEVNVVPHLNKPGISLEEFQVKLQAFFTEHQIGTIHYDWCDDIAYVNRAMITGPGERIDFPSQMMQHIHHTDIEYASKTAHNALEDARAIAGIIRMRLLGMKP